MATAKKRVDLERKMIKAFKRKDAKTLHKLYRQHDKLTQPKGKRRG